MNRNSAKARELVALLASHDVENVSGRNLEDWSQRPNLLPPEGTSSDVLVAHVRELRRVYRPGPGGAARAALILASRGHGCSGLRDALIEVYGATSQTDLTHQMQLLDTEPRPDPDSDEGTWAIEREATEMMQAAANGDGPPPVAAFMAGIIRQTGDNAAAAPISNMDSEGDNQPETPETTVHSALAQVLTISYGGEPTEPEAIARLGTPIPLDGPPSAEDLIVMDSLRDAESRGNAVLANLSSVPIPYLVAGAQAMRSLLTLPTNGAVGKSVFNSPEDLDLLAGMMAPLGLAIVDGLSDGSPEIVTELLTGPTHL